MTTIYVEGSLCQSTGAAGWAGVSGPDVAHGRLQGSYGGAVAMMELAAVQMAVQSFLARRAVVNPLTIAMRSSTTLSVLRWVFPDAPCSGVLKIHRPRRLVAAIRDFQPLYDLHEDIEQNRVSLELRHVGACAETVLAHLKARLEMEAARPLRRRTA